MTKKRPTREGKGGIQDGILLEKKKEYCKNQTYTAEKGCMREGKPSRTVTQCQHAPAVGRKRPGWRISVACGNSSAPGPREDSLHAKICKNFDTRVNAGVFFENFCFKKLISPKTGQNETSRCKITKIWP